MNAAELYFDDGKPAGVFYCRECKRVSKTHDQAEACCLCSSCKEPSGRQPGECAACAEARYRKHRYARYDKATKVAQGDYTGEMVYLDDENEYVSTDELTDRLFDDLESHIESGGTKEDWEPPLVFGTTKIYPRFDLERLIEREMEDSYDDAMDDVTASAKDREELQALLDDWTHKYLPAHYDSDYKVALIIDIPEEPTYDESPEEGCEAEAERALEELRTENEVLEVHSPCHFPEIEAVEHAGNLVLPTAEFQRRCNELLNELLSGKKPEE